jgi:hypothetical protein
LSPSTIWFPNNFKCAHIILFHGPHAVPHFFVSLRDCGTLDTYVLIPDVMVAALLVIPISQRAFLILPDHFELRHSCCYTTAKLNCCHRLANQEMFAATIGEFNCSGKHRARK